MSISRDVANEVLAACFQIVNGSSDEYATASAGEAETASERVRSLRLILKCSTCAMTRNWAKDGLRNVGDEIYKAV